jgi:hypothetical protein
MLPSLIDSTKTNHSTLRSKDALLIERSPDSNFLTLRDPILGDFQSFRWRRPVSNQGFHYFWIRNNFCYEGGLIGRQWLELKPLRTDGRTIDGHSR